MKDVELSDDVKEQVELLQKQSRSAKLYIDGNDENLRLRFFSFLDEFENGRIPNPVELSVFSVELSVFFVERLGITDAKSCRGEIEFLEEQIVHREGDVEPTAYVLNGFVAITRYCRFLLFGFEEDGIELGSGNQKKLRKGLITQEIEKRVLEIRRS
ncbi:hypothetical protein SLA2020_044920 [Shorea laevis]